MNIFNHRKNLEAFDKETRNDNIDISDVDASADLFGKSKRKIFLYNIFPSCIVRQSFYGENFLLSFGL